MLGPAVVSANDWNGPVGDSYAGKPDGPLSGFDTRQVKYLLSNGANAGLQLIGGRMTNTANAAAAAAGYAYANIGKQVTRIGGKFVFAPGSGGLTGSCDFLVMNNFMPTTAGLNSGFHISLTRTGWVLNYAVNGPQTTYASGNYNLVADNQTVYSFDATINPGAGTAVLTLPDGSTANIGPTSIISSSPGIGQYPCFEVYQGNASADDKGAFVSIYAS